MSVLLFSNCICFAAFAVGPVVSRATTRIQHAQHNIAVRKLHGLSIHMWLGSKLGNVPAAFKLSSRLSPRQ